MFIGSPFPVMAEVRPCKMSPMPWRFVDIPVLKNLLMTLPKILGSCFASNCASLAIRESELSSSTNVEKNNGFPRREPPFTTAIAQIKTFDKIKLFMKTRLLRPFNLRVPISWCDPIRDPKQTERWDGRFDSFRGGLKKVSKRVQETDEEEKSSARSFGLKKVEYRTKEDFSCLVVRRDTCLSWAWDRNRNVTF